MAYRDLLELEFKERKQRRQTISSRNKQTKRRRTAPHNNTAKTKQTKAWQTAPRRVPAYPCLGMGWQGRTGALLALAGAPGMWRQKPVTFAASHGERSEGW